MVNGSHVAAERLSAKGINAMVINFRTIKSIDKSMIVEVAMTYGAVVAAEEHQIIGGMGSAVAEILSLD